MSSAIPANRVLVVDDAQPTRERLCAWLEEVGIDATSCVAQREVILGQARRLQPRVVVIDVPVNDRSGFEMLSDLRSRFPECMVIVTMNNLTEEVHRHCATQHVSHCLDKATGFERIVELVLAHGARP